VKRRDVSIVSGHKSRDKVFSVAQLGAVEAAKLLRAAAAGTDTAALRITHGPALTERRSTFQAHVCAIERADDVKTFMAQLRENRHVAAATHNILAWRIETRPGQWASDCDDDGESAAGGRLLHLLTLLRVSGCAVCVSRWYGGILLGAERFKLINAAARAAIEAGGHMPAV
jgi:putative IMPACT (imprinted ancient) family translation regulator